MEINDELIACYVEGKCTTEECNLVREYLSGHPEEYEHVLGLLEQDREDYLSEYDVMSNDFFQKEDSFADIAWSAAAFAPSQRPSFLSNAKLNRSCNPLYNRLTDMCDEFDI